MCRRLCVDSIPASRTLLSPTAWLIVPSYGVSVDSATAYSDSRVSAHAVIGQGPSCPLVGYTRERCLLWQVVTVLGRKGVPDV